MGELHRIAHELGPQRPATDGQEADDRGSRRALGIVCVLLLILGFVVLVSIGTNADQTNNTVQGIDRQSSSVSEELDERAPVPIPVAPPAQNDYERSEEIVDELTYNYVKSAYAGFGQQLTPSQWEQLSNTVCDDMESGGPGLYTSGALSGLPDMQMDILAKASWNALATTCYPDSHPIPDVQATGARAFLIHLASFHNAQVAAEGLAVEPLDMPVVQQVFGGSGSGTSDGYSSYGGSSSSGYAGSPGTGNSNRYTSPYSGGSSGGGYRVQCNDGTYSNSGGKQGACSWHGGTR